MVHDSVDDAEIRRRSAVSAGPPAERVGPDLADWMARLIGRAGEWDGAPVVESVVETSSHGMISLRLSFADGSTYVVGHFVRTA